MVCVGRPVERHLRGVCQALEEGDRGAEKGLHMVARIWYAPCASNVLPISGIQEQFWLVSVRLLNQHCLVRTQAAVGVIRAYRR